MKTPPIPSLPARRQFLSWKASVHRLHARSVRLGLAALIGTCTFALQAPAATTYVRTAGSTGDYGDTTLYTPMGTLPTSADTVTSDGTGTVINFTAPDSGDSLGTLSLNTTSGNTIFSQGAGTFTVGTFNFGGLNGTGTPVYSLTGGTLNIATFSNTGAAAGSNFIVAGGTVNYTGTGFYLGDGTGANTTISISSGTFNANSMTNTSLGVFNNGSGTLALSGSGIFNDSATGTLYLGNSSTGTGSLTLAGSSQFNAANTTLVVSQYGGALGVLTLNGTSSLTTSKIVIGGTGNQNVGGYGVVTLNGGTITTGSITLGNSSVTPSATKNVFIANGGTVRASGASTNFFGGTFVTLGGPLTFDTNNNAVTISNAMSGAGSLTVVSSTGGSGALTLSGLSTFTGTTTVNSGTLNFATSSSSGTVAGIVTVNSGGTLNLTNTNGNGLGYNGTATPLINVNGGTVNAGTATTAVGNEGYSTGFTLTGGTVNYANSGTGTNIGNAYQFNAATNGSINNYTAAAITSNASANLSTFAGAIDIRGGNLGVQVAQGTTTGGVDLLMSGIISGASTTAGTDGLTKYGPGVLTLSAANTYVGVTTVNAGTLQLTGSLASPTLALGGGTFAYAPTTAASTQAFTGTTIIAGGSTVTATSGNTLSLGAITRNVGGVVGFGGAGTITTSSTGANGILGPYAYIGTGTGLSYVTGGGTIAAYTAGTTTTDATGVTDTTGTANYNVPAGGTVGTGASANTLRYTGAGDTITGPVTLNGLMNAGTGALTVNGNVTAGSTNELVVLSNGQNITLNGAVGNNGSTASALTYVGPTAGTLTLTGTNTYTGGTTFAGGIVNVGSTGALGTAGTLIFNGGTLQYSAANTTDYSNRFSNVANQVYNIDTNGQTVTLATSIGNNGSILNKLGAGTLIVSGNNILTGGTNVNGGTLQENFGGQTYGGLRGTVTVNTGGTLALNATNALGFSALSAGNSVAQLNIVGGTVNNMVAGNQGLTANLTMTGGTFSSTGGGGYNVDPSAANAPSINTNASATTALISAPIVQRSGTVSLPFNVALGTTTNGSDLTVSGIISGSGGGITKNGAGALTFTGLNTYPGPTFITAGTLLTGTTGKLGTGNVTLSNTGALTLGNSATIASTATLIFSGNSNTITLNNNTTDTLATIVEVGNAYVLAPGTYTASQLDTDFGVTSFTGGGTLTTLVPEPSTWIGGLMLVGTLGGALRRRAGTKVGRTC